MALKRTLLSTFLALSSGAGMISEKEVAKARLEDQNYSTSPEAMQCNAEQTRQILGKSGFIDGFKEKINSTLSSKISFENSKLNKRNILCAKKQGKIAGKEITAEVKGNTIVFYPLFFSKDACSQASTIAHERTHIELGNKADHNLLTWIWPEREITYKAGASTKKACEKWLIENTN